MIVVVLGVVFVLALVWLATAYATMRNDAELASRRFVAMSKRTQALSKAVEIMNANMDASFDSTDADVAASAKRTMSVLGDAIKREAKVVEASLGRNRKAIAALSALLDANTKSLADLMTKIGTEDKKTLATIMAKMEARHAEIVSYLSGGGMDAVADALATAAVGTEAFTVEHFSAFNMRVALSRFGVSLDDDQLKKLDADLKKDVATGLTLREAMFKRLSMIQPVTKAVKAKAEAAKVAKEQAAMEPVYEAIRVSDQSHREAISKAMADQYAMVQQSLTDLTAQISASKAAAAAAPVVAQTAIAQTIAKVADVKTALSAVQATAPVQAPVQAPAAVQATAPVQAPAQAMRYLSFKIVSVNNGGPQTQLTQASFNDASGKVVPAKMSLVSGNIMGTGFTSADQCFASLQNLDSVTHCNVDPIGSATLVYDFGSPEAFATVRSFYLGGSDDKNRFPSEIEVRASASQDMGSSSLVYRGLPMNPWSNNNTRLKAFDFFKLMQFRNKDGAGTSVTSVDFRDGQSELANGDWFGIRWDGVLRPKVTGTYTFQMSSDDGGSVMIDRALVVANSGTGNVALTAGKNYQIFMNFTENTGEAKMRVEWKGGDQAEFTTDFTKLLEGGLFGGGWTLNTKAPVIWMDGSSWANGVWKDKSGRGNDSSAASNVATATWTGGEGAGASFPYIRGGTGAGVEITRGWPEGEYTFVHLTAYGGGSRGRIWNGKQTNWLSGHWGGESGAVHHNNWLMRGENHSRWTLTLDTRTFARVDRSKTGIFDAGSNPRGIGINQFGGDSKGEVSDWRCAEIVVFEGNLSNEESKAVENYFLTKYAL